MLAIQNEDIPDWDKPRRVYPPTESAEAVGFPKAIRDAYREARMCHRAGAHTTAAIMCRKAFEAICEEHGVKERTLAESLKKLRQNGVIEQGLFDWADALSGAGNEAAHDVSSTVTAEDSSDLLDFTLALGEYLFTFKTKFEEFRERRKRRLAAGSSPASV